MKRGGEPEEDLSLICNEINQLFQNPSQPTQTHKTHKTPNYQMIIDKNESDLKHNHNKENHKHKHNK